MSFGGRGGRAPGGRGPPGGRGGGRGGFSGGRGGGRGRGQFDDGPPSEVAGNYQQNLT